MSDTVLALTDVLGRLQILHEQMLEAADAKRQAIIEGDLQAMESLLESEQKLLKQVEQCEAERKALLGGLRMELKIEENPVKLATLTAALEGEEKDTLAAIHEKLKSVIDALRYRTRQNAELLKVSITHVNEFLQLVTETAQGGAMYGRDGNKRGGSLSLLDASA